MSRIAAIHTADTPTTTEARPRFTLVLGGHLLFTSLHTFLFANAVWLMPMLVRLRFGSSDESIRDWQTMAITAAMPTFMIFSIFWGEILRRVPVRRYILLFWLATPFAYGCVGFVQNYWQLLTCQIIATIGLAAYAPLNGKLLQQFYREQIRGRMYGILSLAAHSSGIVSVYFIGKWIDSYPDAFRVYFPTAAIVELCALGILIWLTRLTRTPDNLAPARKRKLSRLLRPVLHMGKILRSDRTFLRYELAFMTYGAAFMFCDALLPVLATARLNVGYEDFAHSTHLAAKVGMLTMMFPMGWLMDRLGPVRTSGIAFAILAGYPILLIFANDPLGLKAASAVWGLGLAGVTMGWILGPVALAKRPNKVPQYVAVHATLVGIRGVLFQGVGMSFYKLTGDFLWPLAAAAMLFAAAALQMWLLHTAMRRRIRETSATA